MKNLKRKIWYLLEKKHLDAAILLLLNTSDSEKTEILRDLREKIIESGALHDAQYLAQATGNPLTAVELDSIKMNVFRQGDFNFFQQIKAEDGDVLSDDELRNMYLKNMQKFTSDPYVALDVARRIYLYRPEIFTAELPDLVGRMNTQVAFNKKEVCELASRLPYKEELFNGILEQMIEEAKLHQAEDVVKFLNRSLSHDEALCIFRQSLENDWIPVAHSTALGYFTPADQSLVAPLLEYYLGIGDIVGYWALVVHVLQRQPSLAEGLALIEAASFENGQKNNNYEEIFRQVVSLVEKLTKTEVKPE